MRINNDEDYKAALYELEKLLEEITENGGFDNMSKEVEKQLDELSDDIWNWEEQHSIDNNDITYD